MSRPPKRLVRGQLVAQLVRPIGRTHPVLLLRPRSLDLTSTEDSPLSRMAYPANFSPL